MTSCCCRCRLSVARRALPGTAGSSIATLKASSFGCRNQAVHPSHTGSRSMKRTPQNGLQILSTWPLINFHRCCWTRSDHQVNFCNQTMSRASNYTSSCPAACCFLALKLPPINRSHLPQVHQALMAMLFSPCTWMRRLQVRPIRAVHRTPRTRCDPCPIVRANHTLTSISCFFLASVVCRSRRSTAAPRAATPITPRRRHPTRRGCALGAEPACVAYDAGGTRAPGGALARGAC